MNGQTQLLQRYAAVKAKISQACVNHMRAPDEVALLAVSKTFPADAVIEVADAGQQAFGENYVQEAVEKIAQVHARRPDLRLEWHFIGPIQSNKTRQIAEVFAWVHSVDRIKIAERLSTQRPDDKPALNICLQVNISGEASKSGCAPADVPALAAAASQLPRLRLRGLMAIPEPTTDVGIQRQRFAALRQLHEQLLHQGLLLDTLSIGMSDDLDAAIAEGATLVRIGSAIFGARARSPAG